MEVGSEDHVTSSREGVTGDPTGNEDTSPVVYTISHPDGGGVDNIGSRDDGRYTSDT